MLHAEIALLLIAAFIATGCATTQESSKPFGANGPHFSSFVTLRDDSRREPIVYTRPIDSPTRGRR